MYKFTIKLIFIVLSVFLMGLHSLASGPATGSLVAQGEVMINGSASVSQTTLVSGNHITTKENSSAVASLGSLGKVFLDQKTDLVINFNENGVQIELSSGSIRLQKAAETKMEVLTKLCSTVEVMKGEVVTLDSNKKEIRASDNTVKAGEVREYRESNKLLHKGMASDVDYRVSTIECKPGAFPWKVVGPVVGAGAATTVPLVLRGGDNPAVSPAGVGGGGGTVSKSRP